MNIKKHWVDEKEVSRITGISVQTLRHHRSKGKGFKYYKYYRNIRYALEDVYAFMEKGKVEVDE